MGETYMEVLSRGECMRLLPMAPIGWISYCHASHPQLVPVNFLVHQDEVVARTTYGDKLAAAAHELTMSVGVADIDPVTRTGWSVIVTGRARLLGDADDLDLAGITLGPLEAWAPGEKDFYIAIPATEISGRRISSAVAHRESDRVPDSGPSAPSPPSTA